MDLKNDKLCRICLKDNVFFEWIEAIFEFSGPSYKECYYQYTHLQDEVEDPYPKMLCPACASCLRNTHQLVEKALASDKRLKTYKNCDDPFRISQIEKVTLPDTIDLFIKNSGVHELNDSLTDVIILNTYSETSEEQKQKKILTDIKKVNTQSKEEARNENSVHSNEDSASISESGSSPLKPKAKPKLQPLMCMYCSKICYSICKLQNHERTHEKRERIEACSICGLKFYDKICLKSHIEIHTENRERRHKCEFCTKAFFNRGALNVHRRIHLGQMLKCKLCSKEYYRQHDLDRHMQSHDTARITADFKRKPRVNTPIYMDCKTCGKKVAWESWESHKARHLNQPLLQCSICNKAYYTRKPMVHHLKQSHDVCREEYAKFIIKLNRKYKPQFSSLMKQQNITVVKDMF